jgi:hypothetical protein
MKGVTVLVPSAHLQQHSIAGIYLYRREDASKPP